MANSADPNEMLHSMTLHLGLHGLQMLHLFAAGQNSMNDNVDKNFANVINTWVIVPEFKILRLTFNRKSASKS